MTWKDALVATGLNVVLVFFAFAAMHHIPTFYLLTGVGIWFGIVWLYWRSVRGSDYKRGGF